MRITSNRSDVLARVNNMPELLKFVAAITRRTTAMKFVHCSVILE